MKKISFISLAILSVFFLSSCAEEASCSFTGKWKVKTADIQSSTLPETTVAIAREDMLSTTYEFTKDGVLNISGSKLVLAQWIFDEAAQQITWQGTLGEGQVYNDSYQVDSCKVNEIFLSQRMPNNPAEEEKAKISFTLERMN